MVAGDYHHRLFGKTDFSGCEVRVSRSAGYSSDVIRLGVRSSLESPDIGVLTLRPLKDAASSTVSLTTLSAPEKARGAYEDAKKALGKKPPDTEKAGKKLREAVEIFPDFAAAWDLLARTRFADRDLDGAQDAFEEAVEADEQFLSPYLGLAQIEIERQNWAAAIKITQKVIELNRDLAQGYYLDGLAHYYQGDLKNSEKSLLFVKENGYSRAYPMALLHLGIIHTSQGKVAAAANEFQGYLEFTPDEQIPQWHRDRIQQQITQWESEGLIDEKTITAFEGSLSPQ
jgi:tetratricopeptide (TPR) repeat protein